MTDVVIASAVRTPIGKFQGTLAGFTAPQLGAVAAKAAIERAGIPADAVEETIMGNVLGCGLGAVQVLEAEEVEVPPPPPPVQPGGGGR